MFLECCIIYIPTHNEWMLQFFCILSSIWYCHYFLNLICTDVCVLITHWNFNLHFPTGNWWLISFHGLIYHLYIVFKCNASSCLFLTRWLLFFFFFLKQLSFERFFYSLDTVFHSICDFKLFSSSLYLVLSPTLIQVLSQCKRI